MRSESFLCSSCNMDVYFMKKADHDNTTAHKTQALNYNPIMARKGDMYCIYCNLHIALRKVYDHDRSINHLIAIKRSCGDNVSRNDDYLCKICNTMIAWRNLYDHEIGHGLPKRNKKSYRPQRTRSYCGLCLYEVYSWNSHVNSSKHKKIICDKF